MDPKNRLSSASASRFFGSTDNNCLNPKDDGPAVFPAVFGTVVDDSAFEPSFKFNSAIALSTSSISTSPASGTPLVFLDLLDFPGVEMLIEGLSSGSSSSRVETMAAFFFFGFFFLLYQNVSTGFEGSRITHLLRSYDSRSVLLFIFIFLQI